jgi:hypothetical protein
MSSVAELLAGFDPISLDETIEQASLQRRVDTKYLVQEEAVRSLLSELTPEFRILEIDGLRAFHYLSEYLDSPGRDAYRAHVQGRRRRYKCRVRHYVDSGERLVEVKLKGSRGETVKYRTPFDVSQSLADCADFLAICVGDAYGMEIDPDLSAVLEVEYSRITLVSRSGPERVTLDNRLSFRDVETGQDRTLGDSQWIVETKSARGTGVADTALRDAHVHPVSVSKYVLGVALTDPSARVNEYVRLIRGLGSSSDVHRFARAAA